MRHFFRVNARLAGSLTLLIAIVCLILLAGSLDGLEFQPGQPFPGAGTADTTAEPIAALDSARPAAAPVVSGLGALLLLGLMVALPALILRAVSWKRLAVPLMVLAVLLMLAVGLQWLNPVEQTSAPANPGEIALPPSHDSLVSPLGSPPQFLEYLVIAGVTLLSAGVMYAAYRSRQNAPTGDDPVLEEATRAVEALEAGKAWRSVIIRCYAEMCRRLLQEQGLEREAPMTAREFQERLAARGVPAEPVAELTVLFEQARYGAGEAGAQDEERARDSLNQIIEFFQGAAA